MSTLNTYIEKFDDYLNPILVKEIKQTVKTKFFWILLYLILAFEALFITYAFATAGTGNHGGSEIFKLLFGLLMFVSLGAIPIYHSARFANERSEKLDELLYITTITPYEIIRGKFLGGMVIVLFAYGLCSPFIGLTLFLSGVDILKTFITLLISFCFVGVVMITLICMATLNIPEMAKRFLRGFSVVILLSLFFNIVIPLAMSEFLLDFSNPMVVETLLAFFLYFGFIGYFLYGVAASIISPAGTNKMLWVRSRGLILIGITLLLTYFLLGQEALIGWAVIVSIVNSFMVFIATSEPDVLSARIRREIPKNKVLKLLSFPFFTGPLSGIIWTALVHLGTIAAFVLFSGEKVTFKEVILVSNFYLSFLFYGLLASFLIRTFFKGKIKTSNTWGFSLILVVFGYFSIELFSAFFGQGFTKIFSLLNPLLALMKGPESVGVMGPVIIAIMLFLNLKWFCGQFVEYISSDS